VASDYKRFYNSAWEVHPWFQIEFVEATLVNGVTFTNRKDCCGKRFHNVAIHVGDQPAVLGALVTNPECAIFEGPSATGSIEQIICKEPLVGRFLQVQMRDPASRFLQINEIEVINNTVTTTTTTTTTMPSCWLTLPCFVHEWYMGEEFLVSFANSAVACQWNCKVTPGCNYFVFRLSDNQCQAFSSLSYIITHSAGHLAGPRKCGFLHYYYSC
jgi:hypothetical protein